MGGLDDAKEIVRLQEQVKSIKEDMAEMKSYTRAEFAKRDDEAKTANGRMWMVGGAVIVAIVMQVLKTAGVIQ